MWLWAQPRLLGGLFDGEPSCFFTSNINNSPWLPHLTASLAPWKLYLARGAWSVNIDSKANLILTMLLRVDSWISESYNFRVGNDLQVHLIGTSLSPGEKADLQGIGGICQTGRECDYTWMRKHVYSFPVLNSFNRGIVRTQHVNSLGHRECPFDTNIYADTIL